MSADNAKLPTLDEHFRNDMADSLTEAAKEMERMAGLLRYYADNMTTPGLKTADVLAEAMREASHGNLRVDDHIRRAVKTLATSLSTTTTSS